MLRKIVLLLVCLTIINSSFATTWDEPWADEVIKQSSSFVLAQVVSCNADSGVSIRIIKTLSGKVLSDSIFISDFYLLSLCSSSGDGPEFHIPVVDSCYFFITQNKEGKYCIATPSTGFDYVYQGKVAATFRHSYHQALVHVQVYEKMMTAVFNNYHGQPYDEASVTAYVNECISKKPAGFSDEEIGTFFEQHVALECVYHLKLKVDEQKMFPFLQDTANFHNQVSAARALVACNTATARNELLKIVCDTTMKPFVQVICIWTLGALDAKSIKPQLVKALAYASDNENNFGGNIMDPRVCTHLPTVKEALSTLVGKL